MKAIELRLVRLERGGGGWEAYRHLPPAKWPDAALLASLGLPTDAPDADLLRIVAEGRE
jgi:hypothetical protein